MTITLYLIENDAHYKQKKTLPNTDETDKWKLQTLCANTINNIIGNAVIDKFSVNSDISSPIETHYDTTNNIDPFE